MLRLKSCVYCGRVHATDYDCGKKPPKQYRRTASEAGRYTRAWRDKSDEIKSRCHYLCEYCLARGVFRYDGLEVHHIIKLRDRPDLLLIENNLVCLCKKHHDMAERGEISTDELRKLAKQRDK